MTTFFIILVLIWTTPQGKPDMTLRIPMETASECQQWVRDRLDIGMTEHERAAGFLGVGAACMTNYPQVRI